MRKNNLSSLGLILPFLQKEVHKPIYDRDIDMSRFTNKKLVYEHDSIVISGKHSIYRRYKGVKPSLPYQGIARRQEIFMLSVVTTPINPKCVIKNIS